MSECSRGWSGRCSRSIGKRCKCQCGGEHHGKKKPGAATVKVTWTLGPVQAYRDIDAYYLADSTAKNSGESDYGVWWKDVMGGSWRLTYVHATGHIYIVPSSFGSAGPVIILATAPTIDRTVVGLLAPDPAEAILEGWGDVCGKPDSLNWIYDRLGREREMRVVRPKEGERVGAGEAEAGQEDQQVAKSKTA